MDPNVTISRTPHIGSSITTLVILFLHSNSALYYKQRSVSPSVIFAYSSSPSVWLCLCCCGLAVHSQLCNDATQRNYLRCDYHRRLEKEHWNVSTPSLCVWSVCWNAECVYRGERRESHSPPSLNTDWIWKFHTCSLTVIKKKKKCVAEKDVLWLNASFCAFMHLNVFEDENSSFPMWGKKRPCGTGVTAVTALNCLLRV